MAANDAAICNLALLRIGVNAPIDTLDDATAEAQACKLLYAQTRDALLCSAPWPFATKRATLAVVTGATRSGWEFVYALPTDCLTALRIWNGMRVSRLEDRIPFVVEDNGTARVLLCDEEDAELLYVARIATATLLPPLFVDALAWGLAAELAMALAVADKRALLVRQGFELALSRAAAAALNERGADPEPDSEFVAVRG